VSVLVLGVGNLLMGDEGVGVHAAWQLQAMPLPPGVSVVDGGTGGFHLLSYFQDYETIILIDAAMDGGAPGTVALLEPRYASDFPRSLSAHDIGLRDLIESAALLRPLPRMFLVTVSIGSAQPIGPRLSEPIAGAVPRVVETVLSLLASNKGSVPRIDNNPL
jgi:hydrogenase maturation protease